MFDLSRRTLHSIMNRHTFARITRLGTALAVFAVLALLSVAGAQPLAGGVSVALFDDRGATVGTALLTDARADLRVRPDLSGFLTLVVVRPESDGAFYDAFVSFDGSLMVVSESGFERLDAFVGRFTDASLTVAIEADFGDDPGTDAWDAWLLEGPLPAEGPGAMLRERAASMRPETAVTGSAIRPVRDDADDDWDDDDDDWDDDADDDWDDDADDDSDDDWDDDADDDDDDD